MEELGLEYTISGSVVYHENKYSSKELEMEKDRIKEITDFEGLTEQSIVVVAMDRTPQMISCIFALLDTGIPYLMLDFSMPFERMKYMVEHICATVIFTDRERTNLKELSIPSINLNNYCFTMKRKKIFFEKKEHNDIAYLLYTSGTTGKPKAVEVKRIGLNNFVLSIPQIVKFPIKSKIACFSAETFDIFFLETILALIYGMTVVLADSEERKNPRMLIELLQRQEINVVQMTPSMVKMLKIIDNTLNSLKNVEVMLVGGEKLPLNLLVDLQSVVKGQIYNMYGPTETTIWSTVADLTYADEVVIGRPIANTEILLLRDEFSVNLGEVGEICITGIGLANGYCNDVLLTSKAFTYIRNNFEWIRIYRTGDLGYQKENGDYVCLGRKDQQVKIRGHRIELEDVEYNLKRISNVKEVVVCVNEKSEPAQLVCFYISDTEISDVERKEIKNHLPDYMVPSQFIKVPAFVYTNSNKINKKEILENFLNGCYKKTSSFQESSKVMVEKEVLSALKTFREDADLLMNFENQISLDSLEYITFLVELEKKFEMTFEDELLTYGIFETPKDLVKYIVKNIKK